MVNVPCAKAQINTDQVLRIGQNALYFEDYVLSIQYFNAVIAAKPYLAQPYFYRGLAKFYLEDYSGAERDATKAIEQNPFITDAYELRGVVRQNLGMTTDAIADYEKALEMAPYNKGILFNKALAQEEIRDYEGADSTFRRLLKSYPAYSEGYLGRAKLLLAKGDTAAAKTDIDHALRLDKNAVNGYVMRADIAINGSKDFEQALKDMDEAIKLQPKYAGFYINRAYLRHELDDFHGAMDDYDIALQLEPNNTMALFNRSMLRAEVHDFNKAIADLDLVERLKGADFRVLYNRAVIRNQIGDLKGALADINRVIESYPELAAAYVIRYEIKSGMGDRRAAKSDYEKSLALAKRKVQIVPGVDGEIDLIASSEEADEGESQETVKNRFTRLLTIADNADVEQTYNNHSIRGRVQDRNSNIELEPIYTVTYYTAPTELRQSSDFIREVTDLNNSRTLRFLLQVTNREPRMDDPEEINRHFESIEYNTSYLSTHQARPIDYFSRGMDYMTVRNYKEALADFESAVTLQPNFAMGWFMRGMALYRQLHALTNDEVGDRQLSLNSGNRADNDRATRLLILDYFKKVSDLSPDMSVCYFNMGVVETELGDYEAALKSFSRAVELRPGFGEAYFNRGYVNFKLGNSIAGNKDLSRAGELGVVASYNLLKKMTHTK